MIGKSIDPQILELLRIPLDTRVQEVHKWPDAVAGTTRRHDISLFPASYHRDPKAHNETYWHEMGHILWQGMSPEEKLQWSDEYNKAKGGKVKAPSEYGMSGLGEFFSESLVRQLLGEGLDPKIKDLFLEQGEGSGRK